MLNALTDFIPESERIVVIEDTSELRIAKPNLLPAECQTDGHTGQVSFNDLLKAALRWRPDRIILGEVRGDEARTLLDSFNTGHAGSIATIHSSAPSSTFRATRLRRAFGSFSNRGASVRSLTASSESMPSRKTTLRGLKIRSSSRPITPAAATSTMPSARSCRTAVLCRKRITR